MSDLEYIEVAIIVEERVFASTRGDISLVKRGERHQEGDDFVKPHEDLLNKLYKDIGVKEKENYKQVSYTYDLPDSPDILKGAISFAGENDLSIDPFITLQKSKFSEETPVHIWRVGMKNNQEFERDYWVVNKGIRTGKTLKLSEEVNTETLRKCVNSIFLNNMGNNKKFPSESEDPFFILSKQLGLI